MRDVIAVICFALSITITGWLMLGAEQRRLRIASQLQQHVAQRTQSPAPPSEAPERRRPVGETLRSHVTASVGRLVNGRPQAEAIAQRLRQAGWKMQVSEFLLISAGCGLLAALLTTLIGSPVATRLLLSSAALFIPHIGLLRQIVTRRRTIEVQLVDALSMIANALRSGYSFLQAMEVAARELPEPISGEFGQVLRECRVNISVEAALNNLVKRTASADLDLTVTAILIQRTVGGNLGEVLDNISFTIRERLRVRGEVRSMTAQGRMSAMIITMLPVALTILIYMVNPSYMRPLFTHPFGRIALVLAAMMDGAGIFLISRIVRIEL